ncbi:MAG: cohesin domain-containing protein [Dehalococcoidia bacterium]
MLGKGMRIGFLLAAMVATLVVARDAAAEGEVVAAGSAIVDLDGGGAVNVVVQGVDAPGLGAWSINVTYDDEVVAAVGCDPQNGSVCNPAFSPDTVRISGANANGIEGDVTLGTISFRCVAEGTSPLSVAINILADSTIGSPQDIEAATQNGGITCQDAVNPTATPTPPAATGTQAPIATSTPSAGSFPIAGGGPGFGKTDPMTWIIAAFAGAGLAWLSAAVAGVRLMNDGPGRAPTQSTPQPPRVPPFQVALRPRSAARRSRLLPTQRTPIPPHRPDWATQARDRLDDIGKPRRPRDDDAFSDPRRDS